jgi:hypothetical protein
MLLLSVFGTLALVSAQAGWRLADRHAAWTRSVYALEGRGSVLLAQVASCLKRAETLSRTLSDMTSVYLYMHNAEMILKTATLAEEIKVSVTEGGVVQAAARLSEAETAGSDDGVRRLDLCIEAMTPSEQGGRLWRIIQWQYGKSVFTYDRMPDLWPGPASATGR